MAGGRFTCRVPPPSLPQACVTGGLNATIDVDRLEARVSLIEAKEDDLKAQNIDLREKLGDLQVQNRNLTRQLADVKDENSNLNKETSAKLSLLESKNSNLTRQLADVKDQNTYLTQHLGDLKHAVLGQNLSGELGNMVLILLLDVLKVKPNIFL